VTQVSSLHRIRAEIRTGGDHKPRRLPPFQPVQAVPLHLPELWDGGLLLRGDLLYPLLFGQAAAFFAATFFGAAFLGAAFFPFTAALTATSPLLKKFAPSPRGGARPSGTLAL
jgi:hypothetical protein